MWLYLLVSWRLLSLSQQVHNEPPLELSPSLYLSPSTENYMFVGGCRDTEKWTYSSDFSLSPSDLNNLPFLNLSAIFPPNVLSNLSNYTVSNRTFSPPAPSQYVSTLFHPCGVSAHLLNPDPICNRSVGPAAGSCPGQPQLQCHTPCDWCQDSAHFPTDPPPCFSFGPASKSWF